MRHCEQGLHPGAGRQAARALLTSWIAEWAVDVGCSAQVIPVKVENISMLQAETLHQPNQPNTYLMVVPRHKTKQHSVAVVIREAKSVQYTESSGEASPRSPRLLHVSGSGRMFTKIGCAMHCAAKLASHHLFTLTCGAGSTCLRFIMNLPAVNTTAPHSSSMIPMNPISILPA